MDNSLLKEAFYSFASYGSAFCVQEISNSNFTKLVKECGLVHPKKFPLSEADVLFAQLRRRKGERKVRYSLFVEGLHEVAKRLQKDLEDVIEKIIAQSHQATKTAPTFDKRFGDFLDAHSKENGSNDEDSEEAFVPPLPAPKPRNLSSPMPRIDEGVASEDTVSKQSISLPGSRAQSPNKLCPDVGPILTTRRAHNRNLSIAVRNSLGSPPSSRSPSPVRDLDNDDSPVEIVRISDLQTVDKSPTARGRRFRRPSMLSVSTSPKGMAVPTNTEDVPTWARSTQRRRSEPVALSPLGERNRSGSSSNSPSSSANSNRRLSLPAAFSQEYKPIPKGLRAGIVSDDIEDEEDLFFWYTKNDARMTSGQWVRLVSDSAIFSARGLTKADAQCVFSRLSSKVDRRITFSNFMIAIDCLAEKKGVEARLLREWMLQECRRCIAQRKNDRAEDNERARRRSVLANDRSKHPREQRGHINFVEITIPDASPSTLKDLRWKEGVPEISLHSAFLSFVQPAEMMDGLQFLHLLEESDLVDSDSFTRNHVDIVFAKSKQQGERRLRFEDFERALSDVARKKAMEEEDLRAYMTSYMGNLSTSTHAHISVGLKVSPL